jgi:threonyl-tRNA synthetase
MDLKTLRHSAAHLLGHAVSELFPETMLTIGPATEEGFFYDFLPVTNFTEADLLRIEERMRVLAERNIPLTHEEISKVEARILYKNNPFKLELINNIPGDTVGLARQGDFYDLCKGGHVASTGQLKNFKLIGISGSYWRASKTNQPLQRISGTAFFSEQDLREFEERREEAQLYDHRRLGKQLDLFSFHEEGTGFPFFHPKGKLMVTTLTNFMRKLQIEHGYQEISTPMMLSDALWKQSGHYAHYKDNMYFCSIDEQRYAIKPMNCPGAILVYKTRPRSYKELPFKLSEFGHVHRHELSGVLHGLLRVRAFTQDDAHLFCMLNQVESEIVTILKIIKKVLSYFSFTNVQFAVSTRPQAALGTNDNAWEVATQALEKALSSADCTYTIKHGEGAFYGPKIEVSIEDCMRRSWQCGTVQVDFFLPENFDLSYVASSGLKERPVIIHQAIFGSLERFIAILLEHYKGHVPVWLAPVQARFLTVTDAQLPYAQDLFQKLKKMGLRAEVDVSGDPLSGKIRNAQQDKIPWMFIIGQKEAGSGTIALRYYDGKQEVGIDYETLVEKIKRELFID